MNRIQVGIDWSFIFCSLDPVDSLALRVYPSVYVIDKSAWRDLRILSGGKYNEN